VSGDVVVVDDEVPLPRMNRPLRFRFLLTVPALLLAAGVLAGCPSKTSPIKLPPDKYREVVSAFFAGLVMLEVGDTENAPERLRRVTELAPDEPAGWTNLAVYALRAQDTAGTEKALKRARECGPETSELELCAGLLASRQGDQKGALKHLHRATELDSNNVRAQYELIEALDREASPDADTEAVNRIQQILKSRPDNLVAHLDLLRASAKVGNAEVFRSTLDWLKQQAASFPPGTDAYVKQLEQAAAGDLKAATIKATVLKNVLKGQPRFQQEAADLDVGASAPGQPLARFIRLPNPTLSASPPDTAVTFRSEPLGAGKAEWVNVLPLAVPAPPEPGADNAPPPSPAPDPAPVTVTRAGTSLRVGDAAVPLPGATTSAGTLFADLNNDYRMDLVLAGAGGVRLLEQSASGAFADVTSRARLTAVPAGKFVGAWPLDVDQEGDLDVVLGTTAGSPPVLRNNLDGTFSVTRPFNGISGLRSLVWGDFDNDGDPDLAMIDGEGLLRVLQNHRGGYFTPVEAPSDLGKVFALATLERNDDARTDLVLLANGASIRRLSLQNIERAEWDIKEIATWQDAPGGDEPSGEQTARLIWADLDNNGRLDLIASGAQGTQVWLSDAAGALQALAPIPDTRVFGAVDLNEDGRLDLVGLDKSGIPVRLVNTGAKNYHWQLVRVRNNRNVRDNTTNQKLNSFGIGGEVELRAGLLYAKQPITGPRLHFGLGEYPKADMLRFIWPNGQPQGEFEIPAGQPAFIVQRLTGSCPWLFAWDGEAVRFVTDILWKSPLGLRINAQDTAGVSQTRDWVKIRGDQLKPRDGHYDLRITAELWETDFFDHVSLMTVDHPDGTEVFVDERFSIPQPPLELIATGPVRPVARATDDLGADVTEIVRARDGRYLDTFGTGKFQGVTRDHYVEVELPPSSAADALICQGWVYPTDSSINVAMAQGRHPRPTGLSVEVPDGRGGWRTARSGLGFPAGKNKTVVLDLDVFGAAGSPRVTRRRSPDLPFLDGRPLRLRLRTNLEIYWDFLGYARKLPSTQIIKTATIAPGTAELRYRGFSSLSQPRRSSPELPDYDRIAQSGQVWLDLVGFYTRFGDVRELLKKVEDRYVIMNAGDEILLRFPAAAPPPAGWVRDYVFVSDGWDKDGNFNTGFSQTVLPLPSHSDPAYATPPGSLFDDPVYRRYPQDWERYHTRYVSVHAYRNALVPRRSR